jgi:hypothetical protein
LFGYEMRGRPELDERVDHSLRLGLSLSVVDGLGLTLEGAWRSGASDSGVLRHEREEFSSVGLSLAFLTTTF